MGCMTVQRMHDDATCSAPAAPMRSAAHPRQPWRPRRARRSCRPARPAAPAAAQTRPGTGPAAECPPPRAPALALRKKTLIGLLFGIWQTEEASHASRNSVCKARACCWPGRATTPANRKCDSGATAPLNMPSSSAPTRSRLTFLHRASRTCTHVPAKFNLCMRKCRVR